MIGWDAEPHLVLRRLYSLFILPYALLDKFNLLCKLEHHHCIKCIKTVLRASLYLVMAKWLFNKSTNQVQSPLEVTFCWILSDQATKVFATGWSIVGNNTQTWDFIKVKIVLGFQKVKLFFMHSALDWNSWGSGAVPPCFQIDLKCSTISGSIHCVTLSMCMPWEGLWVSWADIIRCTNSCKPLTPIVIIYIFWSPTTSRHPISEPLCFVYSFGHYSMGMTT